jgi:formylglycine-generating enzyme
VGRWLLLSLFVVACAQERSEHSHSADAASRPSPSSAAPRATAPALELLYLPDGGDRAFSDTPEQRLLPGPWRPASGRCPAEMVDIRGEFCIDRFEASLVDRASGRALSPYYHPTPSQVRRSYALWQKQRLELGTSGARLIPVPPPPDFQLRENFEPSARSAGGVPPSGYLSGRVAEQACRNAGKRLCRLSEWQLACRGRQNRKFPYGERFQPGACNVARDSHPARLLHGDPSIHHLDPRLNLTRYLDEPLLRQTGATAICRSEWGSDAVFDMVGNLDEWIDDPDGTFAGGFYSRATQEGCDAQITSHDSVYFDYSLGTRCCK